MREIIYVDPEGPDTAYVSSTYIEIGRVVSFRIEDNHMIMRELCDEYFEVKLDLENTLRLIGKLEKLALQLQT